MKEIKRLNTQVNDLIEKLEIIKVESGEAIKNEDYKMITEKKMAIAEVFKSLRGVQTELFGLENKNQKEVESLLNKISMIKR